MSSPKRRAASRPHPAPQKRPGPPGGQRDQNRRRKMQALGEAALDLFLAQGIEGTRIDEITAAAGVAKGSFYRYYVDKAQLVESLFAPITESVAAALARCEQGIRAASSGKRGDDAAAKGRDDLGDKQALVRAYVTLGLELGVLVLSHVKLIRLYLQERRAPAVGARAPVIRLARLLEQRAETLSESARDRGLLRAWPPPRVSSLAVIGAAEHLLHAYLAGTTLGPPAELPAMLTAIIMEGMRPPRAT